MNDDYRDLKTHILKELEELTNCPNLNSSQRKIAKLQYLRKMKGYWKEFLIKFKSTKKFTQSKIWADTKPIPEIGVSEVTLIFAKINVFENVEKLKSFIEWLEEEIDFIKNYEVLYDTPSVSETEKHNIDLPSDNRFMGKAKALGMFIKCLESYELNSLLPITEDKFYIDLCQKYNLDDYKNLKRSYLDLDTGKSKDPMNKVETVRLVVRILEDLSTFPKALEYANKLLRKIDT